MQKILVVIDMQNDFIDGALGSPEAQVIVPKVDEKIKDYVFNNHSVIYTRDTHDIDYLDTNEGKNLPIPHCIYETNGWEISKDIYKPKFPYIIDKNTFGYDSWRLISALRHADEIEVVGLCTDICVIANVVNIKTAFPEAEITVDASCCAGVTPERHKAALEVMKSLQVNVINE